MHMLYRIAFVLSAVLMAIALHSGRTDVSGGHYDHSTGGYHYHHGEGPHQHYDIDGDGIKDCPIEHRRAIAKEIAKAIATIISYLAALLVPIAVLLIIIINKKYTIYSYSFKKALTQEINKIIQSNGILPQDTDSIHLNYFSIDETIRKESEVQQHLWHIQDQYKENTERLSFYITKILIVCGIACIAIFFTVLSHSVFKSSDLASLIIAVILSLIAFFITYNHLSANHKKKDEAFKKDITLYADNQTYNLYEKLFNSFADLYQFLGIPSDIYFIDQKPSDASYEYDLMPYGTFTRFVAPYSGKCFHQKEGCSGAFLPVNLYSVIYNLTPCSKCSYSDKDCSVPEWYQYYVKLNKIKKQHISTKKSEPIQTAPSPQVKRNSTNSKLRNAMLITSIIGIIATIFFVIFFDAEKVDSYKLLLIPLSFYAIGYLVIGYGFRWKFGKESRWVATLCFSPLMVWLFGSWIIYYLFYSTDLYAGFTEWFSMIGVTISVLIFEYKFFTHDKK